jgi:hypothetical protein
MANDTEPSPAAAELSSSMGEDQIQLMLRLVSIFMPQAHKQRKAVYQRQHGDENSRAPIRFAHYTAAESAIKIINSKRVWMRSTTCMADFREVQHGFDILQRYFADKSREVAFLAALDEAAPGAASDAIKMFNEWWVAVPNNTPLNTYVASVSEHLDEEDNRGRLSMWRAFGASAARVAIVLKIPWHSGGAMALNLMFSPVAYLSEAAVSAVISDVMNNVKTNRDFLRTLDHPTIVNMVFQMLQAGVTSLKHEGFQEEREWRAIYSPKQRASSLMESSIEVVGGVPQPVYKIPLEVRVSPALTDLDFASIFDRLIIGPTTYPWVMYEAFVKALAGAGIGDAEQRVWTTDIPIRA